ncbi:MAG TPA: phosphoglycerate kinase [Bacteroidales bacterium]|nr:phosphoglycerate kinase [Bacteroidales bacterium]
MTSMDKYNFRGKKVLVRVDFNVPLDEDLKITDNTRIVLALPTLMKILTDGGSVIIMTHLGRPKGKFVERLSVKYLVEPLSKLIGKEVKFSPDCIGPVAPKMAKELKPGEILMLENLRFYPEETQGDETFARQLAKLGDAFVMNAFGTAHRTHSSITEVPKFFPYDKMFGFLVESEINHIDKAIRHAKHPFTAIIGGSKVSSKIGVIENLLPKVDNLIIAGAIVHTIIKAMGGKVGSSLVEDDYLDTARKLIEQAKKYHVNLILPTDTIVANSFSNDAQIQHFEADKIPDGWMGLDIGIRSANKFAEIIEKSETILWNGPIGVFEFENFSTGTLRVALSVARATDLGAFSLIGGGDSVAAVNKFNLARKISYISTAGGALLEYIEGKSLPGITAIKQSYSIDDVDFAGKRVLMRVDFNVPMDEKGEITDDTRIVSALPTILKVLNEGASVILISHLGRPKGKYRPELSNKLILDFLSKSLNCPVKFAPDCIGEETEQMARDLNPGEVLLLENIRFHIEETEGSEAFAKQLAKLGDIYIMNAFGTVHRYHSSVYYLPKFFEGNRYYGYLVESEMNHIDRALYHAEPEFTGILGGSKISTKIQIIEALLNKVDNLIITGGIAYTFIKAKGGRIGDSIVEESYLDVAKDIMNLAKKKNVNIYLPIDTLIADKFSNNAQINHVEIDKIPDKWIGMDIGIKSANLFAEIIEKSKTILWNGPVGVFEMNNFMTGTLRIALSVARATDKGAYSIVGGGDSTAAVNKFSIQNRISYVSTAGGALLEYIEGKDLPGIKAIKGNFDK